MYCTSVSGIFLVQDLRQHLWAYCHKLQSVWVADTFKNHIWVWSIRTQRHWLGYCSSDIACYCFNFHLNMFMFQVVLWIKVSTNPRCGIYVLWNSNSLSRCEASCLLPWVSNKNSLFFISYGMSWMAYAYIIHKNLKFRWSLGYLLDLSCR